MSGNLTRGLITLAVIAAGTLSGASAGRQEAQAQILEQASIPCANCFFGNTYYFFCFQAGNQILLAQDKIPTMNYSDERRNFLGKVHKSWRRPMPSGESVAIQYDEKHVWMPRADGKLIRLDRDDSRDVFTSSQCRAAVKKPPAK